MTTKHFSVLLGLLLFFATYPTLIAQESLTLHISVSDHYSGMPLDEAQAALYYRGSEVAHAITDQQGKAVLMYTVTGLKDPESPGTGLLVGQLYPNPFENITEIPLEVTEPQNISVRIINSHGQELLVGSMFLDEGKHIMRLSLGHLPPGIYFAAVTGTENHVVRLVKTGREGGESGTAIRFIQGSYGITNLPHQKKANELKSWDQSDYYLRVTKDRYSSDGMMIDIARDDGSGMNFHLKRYNAVVFKALDEAGELVNAPLQVSGEYFNLTVNAPDTLLIHAGKYEVSCEMDFIIPLDEEIVIKASDTTVIFHLEETEAMLYVQDDPSNDLLFVADHIDGFSVYYHGLRDPEDDAGGGKSFNNFTGAFVIYVTITHEDGSYSVVIFNDEYYPIKWITDDYIISVRRVGGEKFDPEKARISVFTNTEDTMTVNIKTGDLAELVEWLENATGDNFDGARQFLSEYADSFEEITRRALTEDTAEGMYNRVAMAFSTVASAKAFSEIAGKIKKNGIDGQEGAKFEPKFVPNLKNKNPLSISKGMMKCGLNAWLARQRMDRSGITIPIFVCRGATKQEGECQETYYFGPAVSPCIARCPATMDCFIDICAPDVLNIQKALEYNSNY
jgi:hypothetical protein